jgi:hypothetical protein
MAEREWCQRERWCLKTPGHPGDCRETPEETRARINAQAMRDHDFVGEGKHCEAMISGRPQGDPATTGSITMSVGCGYPRQHHPGGEGD